MGRLVKKGAFFGWRDFSDFKKVLFVLVALVGGIVCVKFQ